MLVPDINILVHAYNSNSPRHALARRWWESTLMQSRPVGMPWATALGFIRIMTHRGVLENPMHVEDVVRRVRAWLRHPRVQVLTPGDRHADILFGLLLDRFVFGEVQKRILVRWGLKPGSSD